MHAEYALLDLLFLSLIAVTDLFIVKSKSLLKPATWRAIGIITLLTLIFDNVIIKSGIVTYNPALISGLKLGFAPIEDFAYSLAAPVIVSIFISLHENPQKHS